MHARSGQLQGIFGFLRPLIHVRILVWSWSVDKNNGVLLILSIINTSICRNRVGKGATGPITWLAHAKGFASVKDYLGSRTAKKGSDEFDDDDDGEDRKENWP